MMLIPTFRLSVICGSLSRIAVGAMPFLLPMMFQLGFGLSAAQSGLITFVSSVGSLGMRPGRAGHPAAARLPQRADVDRLHRHADPGAQRGVPPKLAGAH